MLTFRFTSRHFNSKDYLKNIEDTLRSKRDRTVRYFLEAAFAATPVRSGAAQATFWALAQQANVSPPMVVPTMEAPEDPKKNKKYLVDHGIVTGQAKSFGSIVDYIGQDYSFSFEYSHGIVHWTQSESGSPNKAPWMILPLIRSTILQSALSGVDFPNSVGGFLKHTTTRDRTL
jgi:hypothetical protein